MIVAENQHVLRSKQAGGRFPLQWMLQYCTYVRGMIYDHTLRLLSD